MFNRKKKRRKQYALVGDLVKCYIPSIKSKILIGIIYKKIKKTKKFFDYIYYVSTPHGVYKTPEVLITSIVSRKK